MKLSIIVPVYNVERYIKKCIISLLNQDLSYSEYEIIIINDGTKDNSIQIVKELQHSYSNIVLFSQENKGLGAARNNGITKAKGEYIWFVDSDDWIEPNVLRKLYDEAKRNSLECLRFRWKRVKKDGMPIKTEQHTENTSQQTYIGKDFIKNILGYSCYAWSFLFKRDFITKNHLLFTDGMFYEDLDAIPAWLLSAKKVKVTNTIAYNYYIRESSIINSINTKKINDLLKAIDKNFLLSQKGHIVLNKLISHSIIELLRMVSNPSYKDQRHKVLKYLRGLDFTLRYTKNQYLEVFIYNYISPQYLLRAYQFIRLFK